jgi:hypothetical protein
MDIKSMLTEKVNNKELKGNSNAFTRFIIAKLRKHFL